MQREPAEEEGQHHSDDDPKGSLGTTSTTAVHSSVCFFVHYDVTDDDDHEGEDEAHNETVAGENPAGRHTSLRLTLPLLLTRLGMLGVHKLWDAAYQGQTPHGNTRKDGLFRLSFVLAPHWSGY